MSAIILMASFAYAHKMPTDGRTNNELARFYYDEVSTTTASIVDAREHTKLIRDRLECYYKNHEYTERLNNCNNPYAKRIVSLARNSLVARPSLGYFIRSINVCPIMYNMCMGKKNDIDNCILFEKQCIDYFLDEFWRGDWKHTLRENE